MTKFAWRWGWLLCLPVAVYLSLALYSGVERFVQFGVKYDPYGVPVALSQMISNEIIYRYRNLTWNTRGGDWQQQHNALKRIDLVIPESNLKKLDEDLPYSGFLYVEGGIISGDRLLKTKIRYRGKNLNHWGYFKKSLRVKTRKGEQYEGMRKFELIVPRSTEQINSYLSYRLAERMGLPVPRTDLVNLNINGIYRGVYLLVERIDESFLRDRMLMPGDIYSGDTVHFDSYPGVSSDLFRHPGLWDKLSANNHYDLESRQPLFALTNLMANYEAFFRELNAKRGKTSGADFEIPVKIMQDFIGLVDLETFGAFAAFESLTQTEHYNDAHNWRLYYDPAKSRFMPIVWDPFGWHVEFLPEVGAPALPEKITSRLHSFLYSNGAFIRAKQSALDNFFSSGTDQLFLAEMDQLISRLQPSIEHDYGMLVQDERTPWKYVFSSPTRVRTSIDVLRERIEETFLSLRQQSSKETSVLKWSNIDGGVSLQVTGRRSVDGLTLAFDGDLDPSIKVSLFWWPYGRREEINLSHLTSVAGNKLVIDVSLLPSFVNKKGAHSFSQLEPLPGYYELHIQDLAGEPQLLQIRADTSNASFLVGQPAEGIKPSSFPQLTDAVRFQPEGQTLFWQDQVEIEGVRTITDDLIIRPGTTVRLHPGASLVLKGHVLAEGTKQKPIYFVPALKGLAPWGAVVLLGEDANQSLFAHCVFEGGSGLKDTLFEYSGMLSIHEAKGVEVRHCLFRENHETDDMVHVVYSEVAFSDSEFMRSRADALDLDMSKALIERCRFVDSGNDALDLMTTEAVVLESELRGSGDKGISVGEGSTLLAVHCRFVANMVGVQSKDGSVATLYNVDLEGNATALDAYKKNWRYDSGGRIFLYKGQLLENSEMITADKNSKVRAYDSYLDRKVSAKKKRVVVDDTVDSLDRVKARAPGLWRDPEEIELLRRIDARYWATVRPEVRGALSLGR